MPGSSKKAELFIMQLLWKLVSMLQHMAEKAARVSVQLLPPVMVSLASCRREGRKARMRNTLSVRKQESSLLMTPVNLIGFNFILHNDPKYLWN